MNATTPVKPPAPPSRMTLANVKKGKQASAWRMLLYGVEGVGKSTLAAATPSAIFLGAEDGTAHLDVEALAVVGVDERDLVILHENHHRVPRSTMSDEPVTDAAASDAR